MQTTEKSPAYKSSLTNIKVTAILSIIFGAIGTLFGIIGIIYMMTSPSRDYDTPEVAGLMTLLWIFPHIFLIVSGIRLLVKPRPSEVKGLTITTIVIGAIWNVILLAFAIITLTQLGAYQNEYDELQPPEPPKA